MMDISSLLFLPSLLTVLAGGVYLMFVAEVNNVRSSVATTGIALGLMGVAQVIQFYVSARFLPIVQSMHFFSLIIMLLGYFTAVIRLTTPNYQEARSGRFMAFAFFLVLLSLLDVIFVYSYPGNVWVRQTFYLIATAVSIYFVVWSIIALTRYYRFAKDTYADPAYHNKEWFIALMVFSGLIFVHAATEVLLRMHEGHSVGLWLLLTSIYLLEFGALIYLLVKAQYTVADAEKLYDQYVNVVDDNDRVGTALEALELSIETVSKIDTKESLPEGSSQFSVMTPQQMAQLRESFSRILETQFYLDEKTSMPQFAKLMGTNMTYARWFLRDEGYGSFTEMIRALRIDYAREMIRKNPDISQKDLAAMCGYSSYSTFHRHMLEG